jgi:hypothetical protein
MTQRPKTGKVRKGAAIVVTMKPLLLAVNAASSALLGKASNSLRLLSCEINYSGDIRVSIDFTR